LDTTVPLNVVTSPTVAYARHPAATLARFGVDVNAPAVNTAVATLAELVLVAQPEIKYVGCRYIYPFPATNVPESNVTRPFADGMIDLTTPTYAAVSRW
jgi:hypothetical protein